jgi:hypothetical protein
MTVHPAGPRDVPSEPPYRIGGILTLADAMPEPEIVVHPFGVRGQLVAITANPGHGKSTLCLTYAFHHALHRPLGLLRPASDGCVCYISAEDMASTALRAQALRGALRLTAAERAQVDQKLIAYDMLSGRSPQMIAADIVAAYGNTVFDIVIVDTGAAVFFGADENSNTELQIFAQQCRALVDLPGRPLVLLLWHPVKRASVENLLPRGASSLLGTVDGNLTLWREDDVATLSYTKIRAPHFDPMRFSLQDTTVEAPSGRLYTLPIAEPIGEDKIEARDDATRERRERVLLALSSANGERLSISALAKSVTGNEHNKSSVWRHLQHLTGAKPALVDRDPISEKYGLTKAGRSAAAALRNRAAAAYRSATDPE